MTAENKVRPIVGEEVVVTSGNGVLTVTNYRVKYDASKKGNSKFVSISLESISSCGLVTRSRPVLLVLAAITLILALAQLGSAAGSGLLLVIGLGFLVAFFVTRSSVITVSSNGGEDIVVPAKGMSRDATLFFLEAVMDAKLKFIGKIAA